MTYRIIMLVPEGLTFALLTPEQQAAINSVIGQYVLPMPATIPFNGKVVLDGLAADNFDADTLDPLGLPFEIIGQWDDQGNIIVPLDEDALATHIEPDQEGNKVLRETHCWSGWPPLF